MSHTYLLPLIRSLKEQQDPETAIGMAAYMKNKFIFLGIKTPVRKELFRTFVKAYGLPSQDILHTVIIDLWNQPEREFQYAAISLLDKFSKKYREEEINLIEKMITEKSWWDTVDGVAAWMAGDYFRLYPGKTIPVTRKWMDSGNIWLQRSAILFQLHYKQNTDETLLFGYINELTGSSEFFIRKAIGWSLREYSKTNPYRVMQFTENSPLSGLSRREALKVINRTEP
jgi:3-methyladenine DNA glycosylase AlkD